MAYDDVTTKKQLRGPTASAVSDAASFRRSFRDGRLPFPELPKDEICQNEFRKVTFFLRLEKGLASLSRAIAGSRGRLSLDGLSGIGARGHANATAPALRLIGALFVEICGKMCRYRSMAARSGAARGRGGAAYRCLVRAASHVPWECSEASLARARPIRWVWTAYSSRSFVGGNRFGGILERGLFSETMVVVNYATHRG